MGTYVHGMIAHSAWANSVVAGAEYAAEGDAYADIRGMYRKSVLIKNTGANALSYTVLASLDDISSANDLKTNAVYDVTQTAEGTLAAGASVYITFDDLYTAIKVRTKSATGSTATVKFNTSTN